MSAPKFTPGPWSRGIGNRIASPTNMVAQTNRIYKPHRGPGYPDILEQEANADLIAAAPDLFAVLAAIVAEIDRRGLCMNDAPRLCAVDEGLIVQAMAALEKAGGAA